MSADATYIKESMREISDKDIARSVCRAEILAENREEFESLMALRGVTYDAPGYQAFAHQFCDNKIRDMGLQAEFAAQFKSKL